MDRLCFEDIEIGGSRRFGHYQVTREEIVEFARKWDPQPFHLDDQAGRDSIFGGLTACAAHIFAIQSALSHQRPDRFALLAGLGIEELRLITPVRPDDILTLETTILEKRLSKTKPDRGIVTNRLCLLNQNEEVVMEQTGKILVRRRSSTS